MNMEDMKSYQILEWHLKYNHYPPIVNPKMIEICMQAIEAINNNKHEEKIKLENGITRTAAEIAEEFHIDHFGEG